MTITFANPAFSNPNGCDHYLIHFSVTAQIGSATIAAPVMRQEMTAEDPPQNIRAELRSDDLREMASGIAKLEARRLVKAAGATTPSQVNQAVRNQTVVL